MHQPVIKQEGILASTALEAATSLWVLVGFLLGTRSSENTDKCGVALLLCSTIDPLA